ncbi:Six-hairpin glycosidase [Penicillium robsamsonii]|uniref:Six-hairpin glycosidase n=1 Tax=Penicillium robsamsonii TaxID=1792511 RepID=UPI0025477C0B|nr:Six-hairpin glycosidase [Penicillium robsamsonii]KAJ5807328.1 Six-hairpin glycosidase [Penicillium robsamsonii]
MLFSRRSLLVPSLVSLFLTGNVAADDARIRARQGLEILQGWYNTTSGIWNTCGWWDGASCMNTIADLAALDPSVMDTATYVFNNTFHVGPVSNPNPGVEKKTVFTRDNQLSTSVNATQWLDQAYDDDAWWALAWIAAYDVTKEGTYLELAEGIFESLADAWGTNCGGGGLPWSPTSTYVNAITNELFLSVAAHLANRVPDRKSYYVRWAQKEWDWFTSQAFIGQNGTINDGLLDNCQNNGATVWSYNQGVVLGGLVELNRAAPNDTYLPLANKIAKAAIDTLTDSINVIHEFCEPQCLPDGTQFKGIFIRNLRMLQKASPHDDYQRVISSCATSIWNNDRNAKGQFGVNWAGPIQAVVDASTHSSALDALVAAVAALGT